MNSWCAFTSHFDYNTDIHSGCIASAVAREPWSRAYFKRLKTSMSSTQEYEQWGEMWGVFKVDCHPQVQMQGIRGYRNHSFGKF